MASIPVLLGALRQILSLGAAKKTSPWSQVTAILRRFSPIIPPIPVRADELNFDAKFETMALSSLAITRRQSKASINGKISNGVYLLKTDNGTKKIIYLR
jgi:hypothetical protein